MLSRAHDLLSCPVSAEAGPMIQPNARLHNYYNYDDFSVAYFLVPPQDLVPYAQRALWDRRRWICPQGLGHNRKQKHEVKLSETKRQSDTEQRTEMTGRRWKTSGCGRQSQVHKRQEVKQPIDEKGEWYQNKTGKNEYFKTFLVVS